jgi:hypothetical protein
VIVGGKNKGIVTGSKTTSFPWCIGTSMEPLSPSLPKAQPIQVLATLSHTYSSRYSDPETGAPKGGISRFTDTFQPLTTQATQGTDVTGPWVLVERIIDTEHSGSGQDGGRQIFRFQDLKPLT